LIDQGHVFFSFTSMEEEMLQAVGTATNKSTTVTLSGNTAAESAVIFLWDNTSNSTLFLRGEGGSGVEWTSGDIVLAAGHSYTLTVNPVYANGSTEVGTVLNFAVPAPGAIALLGAAGLIGGRRRRA
jgi:hypothetical protein